MVVRSLKIVKCCAGSESTVYEARLAGERIAAKKPVLSTSEDLNKFHYQLQLLWLVSCSPSHLCYHFSFSHSYYGITYNGELLRIFLLECMIGDYKKNENAVLMLLFDSLCWTLFVPKIGYKECYSMIGLVGVAGSFDEWKYFFGKTVGH